MATDSANRSSGVSNADRALHRIVAEIRCMACGTGTSDAPGDLRVTSGQGRRRLVLHAGKSYQFVIPADDTDDIDGGTGIGDRHVSADRHSRGSGVGESSRNVMELITTAARYLGLSIGSIDCSSPWYWGHRTTTRPSIRRRDARSYMTHRIQVPGPCAAALSHTRFTDQGAGLPHVGVIQSHACAHRLKDWSPEALERLKRFVQLLIEWDTALAHPSETASVAGELAHDGAPAHVPRTAPAR